MTPRTIHAYAMDGKTAECEADLGAASVYGAYLSCPACRRIRGTDSPPKCLLCSRPRHGLIPCSKVRS